MFRSLLAFAALSATTLHGQAAPQTTPASAVHHDANFDSERKRADDLFQATKPLEALPLYEDLCRQDSTIAVFAERHAAGLLAKEATVTDPNARMQVHLQAIRELRRALSLGDDTPYVRTILNVDSKTLAGAVIAGIPLTVGYTYHGNAAAQAPFQEGNAAFSRSDWATAAKLFSQAEALDPNWYDATLFAGDSYFRMKDIANASLWFGRAIAIDHDRETAYRYWGDALFKSGDRDGARVKFVEAVVAEPYGIPATAELGQWAKFTGHQLVKPAIERPEFTTPQGALRIDPELAASVKDGRASWLVYQQYRVAHGARTLNQFILSGGSDSNAVVHTTDYRHTVAEEHAALRAMLADIEARLKSNTLVEADLDTSIRNLRNLEKANILGAWIAINAADAGIRSDYPEYRSHHRQHLIEYVNAYLIR